MLAAALFGFAGFAGLCLAMDRHYQDLLGRKPTPQRLRVLRLGGWALLLLALCSAVAAAGWAMGIVQWLAMLMVGLALWIFALPYQPRLLLGLAGLSLLVAPLSALGLF